MAADQPTPAHTPSRRNLLLMTGGAVIAAGLILFAAVLPAEYNLDPLGLGKATGLARLWAPKEVTLAPEAGAQPLAHEYPTPYRTDTVDIPLAASGDYDRKDELEYKMRMKKGGSFVYSWSVEAPKEEFYYDFHGHTLTTRDKMTVSTYKQAVGISQNGSLVAPFDGIHGWYLQNQSEKPVVVKLKISGFYDLVPPGDTGNEAGIIANKPGGR